MSGQLSLSGVLADGGSPGHLGLVTPPVHMFSFCYSGTPPTRAQAEFPAEGMGGEWPLSLCTGTQAGTQGRTVRGLHGKLCLDGRELGWDRAYSPGFQSPLQPLLVWDGSVPLRGQPCCPWPVEGGQLLTTQMRNAGRWTDASHRAAGCAPRPGESRFAAAFGSKPLLVGSFLLTVPEGTGPGPPLGFLQHPRRSVPAARPASRPSSYRPFPRLAAHHVTSEAYFLCGGEGVLKARLGSKMSMAPPRVSKHYSSAPTGDLETASISSLKGQRPLSLGLLERPNCGVQRSLC